MKEKDEKMPMVYWLKTFNHLLHFKGYFSTKEEANQRLTKVIDKTIAYLIHSKTQILLSDEKEALEREYEAEQKREVKSSTHQKNIEKIKKEFSHKRERVPFTTTLDFKELMDSIVLLHIDPNLWPTHQDYFLTT